MKPKLTLILLPTILITILIAPAAAETLTLTDPSKNTYTFTIEQLKDMPQTNEYAGLYCYGNLITKGDWVGVQLSYLLGKINVNSDVKSIEFKAQDAYTITIPIKLANSTQTIIAYQKDGIPLTEGLRLVLPGYNGAAWIAQIISITTSIVDVVEPASVSVDGSMPRSALNEFNAISKNSFATPPAATPAPVQTPKPTTEVPTPNPTTPTPKSTSPLETPQLTTTDQQPGGFDQTVIVSVAAMILFLVASAGLYIRRKRNHL